VTLANTAEKENSEAANIAQQQARTLSWVCKMMCIALFLLRYLLLIENYINDKW